MKTTLFILTWAAMITAALLGVVYLDKHESNAGDCGKVQQNSESGRNAGRRAER